MSATSSPCDDGANLSGNDDGGVAPGSTAATSQLEPSPRKKPRKQQHVQVRDSHEWDHNGVAKGKTQAANAFPASPPQPTRPPRPSLINSYRHTWKSRHNHFLRRSDVRVKEERRPTVNELAAEKRIKQKLDGWKVYHVSAQMEDIVDIEHQLSLR